MSFSSCLLFEENKGKMAFFSYPELMRGVFLISNYLLSEYLLSHMGLLPDAKRFSWKSGEQHYVRENQAVT